MDTRSFVDNPNDCLVDLNSYPIDDVGLIVDRRHRPASGVHVDGTLRAFELIPLGGLNKVELADLKMDPQGNTRSTQFSNRPNSGAFACMRIPLCV